MEKITMVITKLSKEHRGKMPRGIDGRFEETYLSDLRCFHAFGEVNDGLVTSFLAFYSSVDEPAWFCTSTRCADIETMQRIADSVIEYNETNGRLKFYTLVGSGYDIVPAGNRYNYFDEFYVPQQSKCFYTVPWETLYKRTLLPVRTIVRCNFLKQEYRTELPLGGSQ
jgi:hypothetical protein